MDLEVVLSITKVIVDSPRRVLVTQDYRSQHRGEGVHIHSNLIPD
jgi:hypothetical protein